MIEELEKIEEIIKQIKNIRRDIYYIDIDMLTEEQNNLIEQAIDCTYDLEGNMKKAKENIITYN